MALDYGPDGMAFSSNGEGNGLNWTAASETTDARAWAEVGATIAGEMNGVNHGTFFLKWSGYSADDWSTLFFMGVPGGAPALMYERSAFGLHGFNFAGNSFNFYNSQSLIAVRIDTTQATIQERIKFYTLSAGVLAPITPDGGYGGYTLAQNAAIGGMVATDQFVIGNRPTGNDNGEGMIKCVGWETNALDEATIEDVLLALAADDDTMPATTPTLSFIAAPSADQITASSVRINLTTSLAATVKIIGYDNPAQAQPAGSVFDAVAVDGTTVASTVFRDTQVDLPAGTARRYWVEITEVGGAGAKLYASVNATTLTVSNSILSINGGNPIRYDQTSFQIVWDEAPSSLSAVTINGVAQGAHTAVNSTTTQVARTAANWPATRYNTPVTLTTGSASGTTSMAPAATDMVVRLASGYVENPPQTIDSSGDAVAGDEIIIRTQNLAISIDTLGRLTFTAGFNGVVEWAIVDQADGAHSAFVGYPYAAGADILPTVPTLIANVTGANPGQVVQGSFVLAGVTAATDIPVVAGGFMEVSTASTGPWLSSITRQNGQTVHYRITAGAFLEIRTGNVSMNGVTAASPLSVTTRAANAPSITTQPANQSVTSGAVATYNVVATNAATYQWQKDTAGNGTYANISGATSATYARTTSDADLGASNVRCIVTSSEGASTTSASATLTVIAAATRLVIPAGVVTGRGASMAGATAVPVNIRNVNGALIHSTTVTIAASGVTNIDSNQNGAVGTDRFVGFPSSVDGSEALIRLTVQAAS